MTPSDVIGKHQAQPPGWRRRLRGALLNLLLMLTSIAVILGLCEIGLRLFYPAGGQPKINDFDPLLGHRLKPNLDLVHIWPAHENVSTIRTNSAGFRGPELPEAKQPGEFRVLLLGDSYTFGFGVGDDDTFAHRLQEMLDGRAGAPGRVSVINAGISSYGTAQQLLLYESARALFEPDLVVLNLFVGNDVQENLCLAVPRLQPHRRFPCFGIEDDQLTGPELPVAPRRGRPRRATLRERVAAWLESSHLYQLAFQRAIGIVTTNPALLALIHRLGWQAGPDYLPHVVAGWYQEQYSERGWLMTRLLLRRLHLQVSQGGARLMVTIIPSRIQIIPELLELSRLFYPGAPDVEAFFADQDKPQRQLSTFLAAEGIPSLDLLPVLREDGRGDALYYPVAAHWNEEGHQVAATALLRFMEREALLTTPARGPALDGPGKGPVEAN